MPYRALALSLSLLPALAVAQSTSSAPATPMPVQQQVVPASDRALVHKPSIEPLEAAFGASGRPWAFAYVHVDYDANGDALGVILIDSSGDETLDLAIQAWAADTRIAPGSAFRARGAFPFSFLSEHLTCAPEAPESTSCLRDYGPGDFEGPVFSPLDISLFTPLISGEQVIELYFEHDASGRVSWASGPSRGAIAHSITKRIESLRLKTGSSGYGRLRVRLVAVSDAREAAMYAGQDVVLIWKTEPGDPRLLVRKTWLESRLAVRQQLAPPNVPGDVHRVRIFHDAEGRIVRLAPVARPGENAAALQSMMDDLLLDMHLEKPPGRAGSLRAQIYPDGSVLPVE
jgi:hypothetical protein